MGALRWWAIVGFGLWEVSYSEGSYPPYDVGGVSVSFC